MPGRNNNCGECSRAVDNTWEGEPAVAAALSDPDSGGEPTHRMADWAGTALVKASMDDIGQRLADLGPGSSAIVGCDWVIGGGHWFNAINDEGTVKAVDGQSAKIENWPPSAEGLGFDESTVRWSDAIFFTADGKTINHDHARTSRAESKPALRPQRRRRAQELGVDRVRRRMADTAKRSPRSQPQRWRNACHRTRIRQANSVPLQRPPAANPRRIQRRGRSRASRRLSRIEMMPS